MLTQHYPQARTMALGPEVQGRTQGTKRRFFDVRTGTPLSGHQKRVMRVSKTG